MENPSRVGKYDVEKYIGGMEPLKAMKLPHALETLIEDSTAKHADRRPPGLAEVRTRLHAIMQGLPPAAN